ncbi:MAG TPA: alpha/beta hydrolase-fold protein [Candidatus Sulfotelmatobacter sp.]|jgi:predicted alpha/beta superfamily hydrolase|nr:alpha/beta hydrolase-fold protein [Candidatus Sulfotelmatobacter sp.]
MNEIVKTKKATGGTAAGVIRVQAAAGDLRLHKFRSRVFRNSRFLRAWLPPGYDDPANAARHYPVLYLNDGQNLFEASTSFTGVEWQVDETSERLVREGAIPPLIVVGIDNAGKDRLREYMPHRSLQPMRLRVQGSLYPNFLMKEVMPFIAQNYRVASGPENTGLGGSSLGALVALYTVASRPDVFGRLLIESPSLWASNRQMIRDSRAITRWPQRIFLSTGTAEAGRPDKDQSMVDDVRELAAILHRAGLDNTRLRLLVEEGGTHHESAWARRFPEALAFLFGSG